MKGQFYVIGVGPGDPELLTLKAKRILGKCEVWFAPSGRHGGESTALKTAEAVVDRGRREILTHYFPMKKIRMGQDPDPEVKQAWREASSIIFKRLREGKDVVFPTMGDPAIYSTGFYVLETLLALDQELVVEVVPGISSMGASSAAAGQPLCLGDDRLVVIPATFENGYLKEMLENFDSVVLMKVHRVMGRLVPLLEEMNLLDRAVLVERTSHKEQRIRRDLAAAALEEQHYFSTVIVRKS